jgi:hypothetical protein
MARIHNMDYCLQVFHEAHIRWASELREMGAVLTRDEETLNMTWVFPDGHREGHIGEAWSYGHNNKYKWQGVTKCGYW